MHVVNLKEEGKMAVGWDWDGLTKRRWCRTDIGQELSYNAVKSNGTDSLDYSRVIQRNENLAMLKETQIFRKDSKKVRSVRLLAPADYGKRFSTCKLRHLSFIHYRYLYSASSRWATQRCSQPQHDQI